MWRKMSSDWPVYIIFATLLVMILVKSFTSDDSKVQSALVVPDDTLWHGPSLMMDRILTGPEREEVVYGYNLISNTAYYLGPQGTVAQISNGMNCQNCHLDGGRRAWGNNYGAVSSTYPKFRERSGTYESIYKRVGDCFERSLNGTAPDSSSREFLAIQAYIQWLGKDVAKGEKPAGSGIEKLPYLKRAADPQKGLAVYLANCKSCHGENGEGQMDGNRFVYPPLWGPHSYNDGAGLFRLSNFAGFVKGNMPFNIASHAKPTLTSEEAWDVAAYVNSQPRPHKDQTHDWPDVAKKPIDFAFGPYADGFDEKAHKYGPYEPIANARNK